MVKIGKFLPASLLFCLVVFIFFFVPQVLASNNAGKLGLQIACDYPSPEGFDAIINQHPAVIKLMDGYGCAGKIKQLSPSTIVVGRIYDPNQPMDGDPGQRAQEWFDRHRGTLDAGGVDCWEGYNEPPIPDAGVMGWYSTMERRRTELLAGIGKRACIGNFSVGVPQTPDNDGGATWAAFRPALEMAMQNGGYLGLHEYSAPNMRCQFNDGDGTGWFTGRYRKAYRGYLSPTGLEIPLIITETGMTSGLCGSCGCSVGGDQGWRALGVDAGSYTSELQWYNTLLEGDGYVRGAAIFVSGYGDWGTFDLYPELVGPSGSLISYGQVNETCTIGKQSPDMGDSCAGCIKNQSPSLVSDIKNLNPPLFTVCSDTALLNYWCNGGISSEATNQCNAWKNGACLTSCNGTPNPTSPPNNTPQPTSPNSKPVPTFSYSGLTAFYRIVEAKSDSEAERLLDSASDIPYGSKYETTEPIKTTFTLKDQTPGIKWLYVRFLDSQGKTIKDLRKSIKLLPPDPQITSASCTFSPTGSGTEVTVKGLNFGDHTDLGQGKVIVGGKEADILSWTNTVLSKAVLGAYYSQSQVVAKTSDKLEGKTVAELTTDDGKKIAGSCSINTTTVDFTARTYCRTNQDYSNKDVSVKIYEEGFVKKPLYDLKVNLDSSGQPQNFTPKVEVGKKYEVLVGALRALARKATFTADAGTNLLPGLILPVGDIQPQYGDGIINSMDSSEMIRQWDLTQDSKKSADLNNDNRVNSLDYSCLLQNFNQSSDKVGPGLTN